MELICPSLHFAFNNTFRFITYIKQNATNGDVVKSATLINYVSQFNILFFFFIAITYINVLKTNIDDGKNYYFYFHSIVTFLYLSFINELQFD